MRSTVAAIILQAASITNAVNLENSLQVFFYKYYNCWRSMAKLDVEQETWDDLSSVASFEPSQASSIRVPQGFTVQLFDSSQQFQTVSQAGCTNLEADADLSSLKIIDQRLVAPFSMDPVSAEDKFSGATLTFTIANDPLANTAEA